MVGVETVVREITAVGTLGVMDQAAVVATMRLAGVTALAVVVVEAVGEDPATVAMEVDAPEDAQVRSLAAALMDVEDVEVAVTVAQVAVDMEIPVAVVITVVEDVRGLAVVVDVLGVVDAAAVADAADAVDAEDVADVECAAVVLVLVVVVADAEVAQAMDAQVVG